MPRRPPRLRAGRVERPRDDGFLELLLGSVDPAIRYALDLRDPSWDGVEDRLAAAGAVRVDDRSGNAGWAYLRFRELTYSDAELGRLEAEVRTAAVTVNDVFAYFRHGTAPDAAVAAVRLHAACATAP